MNEKREKDDEQVATVFAVCAASILTASLPRALSNELAEIMKWSLQQRWAPHRLPRFALLNSLCHRAHTPPAAAAD